MQQDNFTTEVIFRKWEGEIIALFPYEIYNAALYGYNTINSYMHIGQHSSADYNHIMEDSKPAKVNEYLGLKKELENIGYNLQVIEKRQINKALASYKTEKQKLITI